MAAGDSESERDAGEEPKYLFKEVDVLDGTVWAFNVREEVAKALGIAPGLWFQFIAFCGRCRSAPAEPQI